MPKRTKQLWVETYNKRQCLGDLIDDNTVLPYDPVAALHARIRRHEFDQVSKFLDNHPTQVATLIARDRHGNNVLMLACQTKRRGNHRLIRHLSARAPMALLHTNQAGHSPLTLLLKTQQHHLFFELFNLHIAYLMAINPSKTHTLITQITRFIINHVHYPTSDLFHWLSSDGDLFSRHRHQQPLILEALDNVTRQTTHPNTLGQLLAFLVPSHQNAQHQWVYDTVYFRLVKDHIGPQHWRQILLAKGANPFATVEKTSACFYASERAHDRQDLLNACSMIRPDQQIHAIALLTRAIDQADQPLFEALLSRGVTLVLIHFERACTIESYDFLTPLLNHVTGNSSQPLHRDCSMVVNHLLDHLSRWYEQSPTLQPYRALCQTLNFAEPNGDDFPPHLKSSLSFDGLKKRYQRWKSCWDQIVKNHQDMSYLELTQQFKNVFDHLPEFIDLTAPKLPAYPINRLFVLMDCAASICLHPKHPERIQWGQHWAQLQPAITCLLNPVVEQEAIPKTTFHHTLQTQLKALWQALTGTDLHLPVPPLMAEELQEAMASWSLEQRLAIQVRDASIDPSIPDHSTLTLDAPDVA